MLETAFTYWIPICSFAAVSHVGCQVCVSNFVSHVGCRVSFPKLVSHIGRNMFLKCLQILDVRVRMFETCSHNGWQTSFSKHCRILDIKCWFRNSSHILDVKCCYQNVFHTHWMSNLFVKTIFEVLYKGLSFEICFEMCSHIGCQAY